MNLNQTRTLTRDNYGTPKNERINDVDDIIFDEQIAGNTFFFSLARGGSQTSPCEGPWSCGALPCQQVGWIALETSETLRTPCESHRHLFS